jgi:spore maturation protein CgeB
MRILCIGETWFGSDARAAFAALRRLGHSVHVLDEAHFVPTEWTSFGARLLRRAFRSLMVDQLSRRAIETMKVLEPEVLLVFKGNYVSPDILDDARARGILSVNYYPDVSFMAHGPQLPRALPKYDHVFNAKTFGVKDMVAHGVKSVSFLAPGFDPELHRPVDLTSSDRMQFGCDVSFIGTWSPKKENLLSSLRDGLPEAKLRIWGYQWEKRTTRSLDGVVAGTGIIGDDYTRAIRASSICLGLLSEARTGSSSGDLITARTFQIPACGTFMLHERTSEVEQYFKEGEEAEFFDSPDELIAKVQRYLSDPDQRQRIAEGGLRRSIESDYSIDRRMREACDWIASKLG